MKIIFLRHGQSEYTEVFPDLTEEGKKTIIKVGRKLKKLLGPKENVIILSSPRPRALSSARLIQKIFGNKRCSIILDANLSSMKIKDKKRAREIFEEYLRQGGARALDLAYTKAQDPRFEDSKIFESRSAIRQRFFCFLKSLVKKILEGTPSFIVCISHLEVLYHLIIEIDTEPIKYGELIEVSVFPTKNKKEVYLEIAFRREKKRVKLPLQ